MFPEFSGIRLFYCRYRAETGLSSIESGRTCRRLSSYRRAGDRTRHCHALHRVTEVAHHVCIRRPDPFRVEGSDGSVRDARVSMRAFGGSLARYLQMLGRLTLKAFVPQHQCSSRCSALVSMFCLFCAKTWRTFWSLPYRQGGRLTVKGAGSDMRGQLGTDSGSSVLCAQHR
jgi:hypothetical protein